ncbi:hypothetical protein CDAR_42021 [Caerostris darwini]|uniref:Uncharacterized protein n=1 Tax=Caerostris darwini TaxID=1538125 RepID=A0AAV4RGE2_9ARAC|nr:hypothetical protein CDAR_42021 [Caerostris darwini]
MESLVPSPVTASEENKGNVLSKLFCGSLCSNCICLPSLVTSLLTEWLPYDFRMFEGEMYLEELSRHICCQLEDAIPSLAMEFPAFNSERITVFGYFRSWLKLLGILSVLDLR